MAVLPAESAVEPPLPESIPGLRNRKYGTDEFRLLESIAAGDGLEAREFSYKSDGNRVYGLIEQPAGEAPEGGWPVIVVAHGYIPPDQWSTTRNYRLVTGHYAAGGFLVVKPDYRGHGRSEGESNTSIIRTINYSIDVMNLIASLDDIPDADVDNVFLYGHSMGGEIGLRILTVNDTLRAATLWAGVTEDYPENTLYFVGKRSPETAAQIRQIVNETYTEEQLPTLSPGNYLESIDVPVYVHHGTLDESVPFEWSIPFRSRLDAAGVEYSFFEYPGENHNISRSFYRILDADMEFFRSQMN